MSYTLDALDASLSIKDDIRARLMSLATAADRKAEAIALEKLIEAWGNTLVLHALASEGEKRSVP